MKAKKIGFALCGSFCTFDQAIPAVAKLVEQGHHVVPLMSEYSYATDTRFGRAKDFADRLEGVTGSKLIHTIRDAEPIGPGNLLDLLIIAPCTGNTLGKMAWGITDTAVTMAAKAHLRNEKPVLIAVSTNDALGAAGKNIGSLMNYRQVFFVPMKQDAPDDKPRSMVADFEMIPAAAALALEGVQIQPVYR